MNYETIMKIYDEVDEYIIDEHRQASRSDTDTMTRLTHEARATGASIALSMMMREIMARHQSETVDRVSQLFRNN